MSEVMKLTLMRGSSSKKSIIGKLYVDGVLECFTLEDVERTVKIMHETCIPKGVYDVIINVSNRFQKRMPLLLNVPNFEGIRIHSGNTDKDTSGCILVGNVFGTDRIGQSKLAYEALMEKLEAHVEQGGKITIKII